MFFNGYSSLSEELPMVQIAGQLDLAQRITHALSSQNLPVVSIECKRDPQTDIPLGTIPEHLRKLYLLYLDVEVEWQQASKHTREQRRQRYLALQVILIDALEVALDFDASRYQNLKVCQRWQLAGVCPSAPPRKHLFTGNGLERLIRSCRRIR